MGGCISKTNSEKKIKKNKEKKKIKKNKEKNRIPINEEENRIPINEEENRIPINEEKKSSTSKDEEITVMNLCEENSNETPHKLDMSHQNLSNELIEVSVNKREVIVEIENNLKDCSGCENKSAQEMSKNTKSKICESREIYFASFLETESNQHEISKVNKNVIKPTVVEKEINKWIKEFINTILERTFSEIIKKQSTTVNIATEILDTILLEIILEIAEKKRRDEIINELIKDVLSNAIHTGMKVNK